MKNIKIKSNGQALMEYLIVLVLVILIGGRALKAFSEYFADSIGRFNVVLSSHLTVGVCERGCFPDNYRNGKTLGE